MEPSVPHHPLPQEAEPDLQAALTRLAQLDPSEAADAASELAELLGRLLEEREDA